MKVHHIGYLVKKMEKAKAEFLQLGYEVEQDTVYDEYRGIDICFISKDGYRVELVSPVDKESVVAGMMKKYGNSPYHICYESYDFDKDMADLAARKYVQIDEPHAAVAIEGKRVVFMMHPYLGMIELIEM